LGNDFGATSWQTWDGHRWKGSLDDLAAVVSSFVVQNSDGQPEPKSGYTFKIAGVGTRVQVTVWIAAGAVSLGGRIPLHNLLVTICSSNYRKHGLDRSRAMWQTRYAHRSQTTLEPSMMEFGDSLVRRTARRGGWKIGVGYHTWNSAEVGSVNQFAPGLTTTELAGGTLIPLPTMACPACRGGDDGEVCGQRS
jgi:hypothetical protein